MELLDFLAHMMEITRNATLRVTANLTQEEAAWRPLYGANSVGFILWHIARIQDGYFNRGITQGQQIWEKNGWYQKFNLPARDTGNSYTVEQVENFIVPDVKELFVYLDDVQESSLQVLKTLTPERLQEVPRQDRPDMTVLRYIRQHITHENQHIGAVEYILGLARSKTTTPW